MKKLSLALLLLLTPSVAQAQFYNSAKTFLNGNTGFLITETIRVIPVNLYEFDATDDYTDVIPFMITDGVVNGKGKYCNTGWPAYCQMKLMNTALNSGSYTAIYAMYPWLMETELDGLVFVSWDPMCGGDGTPMAPHANALDCISGTTHKVIAYHSLSFTRLVDNQPLIFQWGGGTVDVANFDGEVFNVSDANPDNWTVTAPTVVTVTFEDKFLNDCNPCADVTALTLTADGTSGRPVSGTIDRWNRYVPTNEGQIVIAHTNHTSNLRFVLIEGWRNDGWRHTSWPSTSGRLEFDGGDFFIYKNIEATVDLRTDRGDFHHQYQPWNGCTLTLNTDYALHPNEADSSCGSGSDFPGGGGILFSTTSINVAVIDSWIHGLYGGGTWMGKGVFIIDTLYSHMFNGPSAILDQLLVCYRCHTYDTPNHNISLDSPVTARSTAHFEDWGVLDGQDWMDAGNEGLSADGLDELFLWHGTIGEGKQRPTDNSGPRIDVSRVRKQFVALDLAFAGNAQTSMITGIPYRLLQQDNVVIANLHMSYFRGFPAQTIAAVYEPLADNNTPMIAASSPITGTAQYRICSPADKSEVPSTVTVRFAASNRNPNGSLQPSGRILAEITLDGVQIWNNGTGTLASSISGSNPGIYINWNGTLTTAVDEEDIICLRVYGDATYNDFLAANPTSRIITATHGTVESWDTTTYEVSADGGKTWSSHPLPLLFVIDSSPNPKTITQMNASWGQYENSVLAADGPFVDWPVFDAINYNSVVGMPNPGNQGNEWGFKVATNLAELRSWIRPATGSDLLNAASDGGDIGITGTSSIPGNARPVANAGPDLVIESTGVGILNGSASDDGLPSGMLTYLWSRLSGPGTVDIDTPTALISEVSASPGVHQIQLAVSDGVLTGTNTMQLTVTETAVNTEPIVSAGSDKILTLGCHTITDPSVTDDGLNVPYTLEWDFTSIPTNGSITAPTFESNTVLQPIICFYGIGYYTVRLRANDGEFLIQDTAVYVVTGPTTSPRYILRR